MLVYRLEDDKGKGIYDQVFWAAQRSPDIALFEMDDRHPGPHTTFGDWWQKKIVKGDYSDYSFGFDSMEQLQKWFHNKTFNRAMVKLGARLVVYKVHGRYVRRGEEQTVFKKSMAEVVETLYKF